MENIKTIAEQIADLFDNDGQCFETEDGRNFEDVCKEYRGLCDLNSERGLASWTFADGSTIVGADGGWDLKHPDCTCGFCWAGVEVRCPDLYEIWCDNESETIQADSMDEAEEAARDWIEGGDWGEGKCYVTVYIRHVASDERSSVDVEVGEDAPEPDCVEGHTHDWRSPKWLGGCDENPGVWSVGGTQIESTEVCCHCGQYRDYTSESTPGNHPRTPAVTTYREADEDSIKWIAERNG